MSHSIKDRLDGPQWSKILQNTSETRLCDESHGKLHVSSKEIQIEIIDPQDKKAVFLSLDDVVEISDAIMQRSSREECKGVKSGLLHLDSEIEQIKKHFSGRQDFRSDVMFFHDDVERIAQVAKKAGLALVDTDKQRLIDILSSTTPNSVENRREIQRIIEKDINLLFNLTEYGESFFDLAIGTLHHEVLLDLVSEIDKKMALLQKENRVKFLEFLFSVYLVIERGERETSVFETSMQTDEANTLFDHIMSGIDQDEFNLPKNSYMRKQVYDFGYSSSRYRDSCMEEGRLSPALIGRAESLAKACIMPMEDIQNMEHYDQWLLQRMAGSTTCTMGDPRKIRQSQENWKRSRQKQRETSSRHREKPMPFHVEIIKIMHSRLTSGEEDVPNPGKFREGIVRTSGGFTHTYCSPHLIEKNIDDFFIWFNESLEECTEGRKNPIICAAQAYQRFVSIHPFENGNGRVARLLMDYVLERFNLPPPLLGDDVLDAIFPLDPLRMNHDEFIEKILNGIEESKRFLEFI